MQNYWFIGFMVMIGAVIGGMTNSLAIKMLFRPYREIRIGSWRVPFTPGLIPKRHEELSTQLGRMVVQYLLTAEGLGKKIKSASFVSGLTVWLQDEVTKILRSDNSVTNFLEEKLKVDAPKKSILEKTETMILTGLERFFVEKKDEPLGTLLPNGLQKKAQELIPEVSEFLLKRGQTFLESTEGKRQLSQMIDRFLADKGTLMNMISMFLGNERLVDKVQPELLKFLRNEGTKGLLVTILLKEWNELNKKTVADFEGHINKGEVASFLVKIIDENVPAFQWIGQPMNKWTAPYEDLIVKEWAPTGVQIVADMLFDHLESLLERLQLEEIVREQVQAFSVERLEELVLSISKKEFKMITYLGALIGGIIGLIQGVIVLTLG